MRFSNRRPRAFSLLELVVAIGVFALFTLTLSRLMMGGMQTFQRGEALNTLRGEMRQALDLISSDFRQSTTNVIRPAYTTLSKSLTLTFSRYELVGGTPSLRTVTYTIDGETNRLTRTDLNLNQTVLVADNILVGLRPGETTSESLSQSYFVWAVSPNLDTDRDYGTLEVRLTGMNREQRLSMVTRISQRLDDLVSTSPPPAIVSLMNPTDLRPPRPVGL